MLLLMKKVLTSLVNSTLFKLSVTSRYCRIAYFAQTTF